MTVPGFTAEAGLYKPGECNQTTAEFDDSAAADHRNLIQPQLRSQGGIIISLACWIVCRGAGGTRQQCLEFCTVLTTVFFPVAAYH
jgi:hypothetical protein